MVEGRYSYGEEYGAVNKGAKNELKNDIK